MAWKTRAGVGSLGLIIIALIINLNYNVTENTHFCPSINDSFLECDFGISGGVHTRCYTNQEEKNNWRSAPYCPQGWININRFVVKNDSGIRTLYEQKSRQVPIYKYEIIYVAPIFNPENSTWSKPYNYTKRTLDDYETLIYDGRKIGLRVGNKTYSRDSNFKNNKIYVWTVPQADRNYKEFGTCRSFEKEKGVCHEKTII